MAKLAVETPETRPLHCNLEGNTLAVCQNSSDGAFDEFCVVAVCVCWCIKSDAESNYIEKYFTFA